MQRQKLSGTGYDHNEIEVMLPMAGSDLDIARVVQALARATVRVEQLKLLNALIRSTPQEADVERTLTLLQVTTPSSAKLVLEYLARWPGKWSIRLSTRILPLLAQRTIPSALRLHVAGRIVASLPDTRQSIEPVVKALTTGLSRSRKWQRLFDLQCHVEVCRALDELVEDAEARVKLKCPQCPTQWTRTELIRHLWSVHGVAFQRGAAIEPRLLLERAVLSAAASDDPAELDVIYQLVPMHVPTASPLDVLQAVVSRQGADEPVPDMLLRAALEQHCGLCPRCFSFLNDPIPLLPPPLAFGAGRLSGNGYNVEVKETFLGRVVNIHTPKRHRMDVPTMSNRFDRRTAASLATIPLFLLASLFVLLLPKHWAPQLTVFTIGCAVCLMSYVGVRYSGRNRELANTIVIDVAWVELVPKFGLSKSGAVWLMRLCRSSFKDGSSAQRLQPVSMLVGNAMSQAGRSETHMQLFATCQVLKAWDDADRGQDLVTGYVDAIALFFLLQADAVYLETVAECLVAEQLIPEADRQRLAILLLAKVFAADLTVPDVERLSELLPNLAKLLGQHSQSQYEHFRMIWRARSHASWLAIGPATTIFDLAITSPAMCRRILREAPDCLLVLELPDRAERELGDVYLTPHGIRVLGKLIHDADERAMFSRSPRGTGWDLVFGSHRFHFDRKLDDAVIDTLQAWLRYRQSVLIPALSKTLDTGNPSAKLRTLLSSLVTDCKVCGTACLCRAGQVGHVWPTA